MGKKGSATINEYIEAAPPEARSHLRMLTNKIDLLTINRRLGHSKASTTLDTYTHRNPYHTNTNPHADHYNHT